MNTSDFFQQKKAGYKEAERKTLKVIVNGRSADFIIPNFARGCELGCTYCYVARHTNFGNPVTLYTNRTQIWKAIKKHYQTLGPKTPNQCDPVYWTYDIGEATDCLSPKILPTSREMIERFLTETDAKPTFATKLCTGPKVLEPVPAGRARVRISLMPQHLASILEKGTSQIQARIASIPELVSMGYEVHLNFSPVVVYTGWTRDYAQLMKQVAESLDVVSLQQLKAEVIFLTHSPALHQSNLTWTPEAEELLWTPQWQENKTTQRGDADVLRYQYQMKQELIAAFKMLMATYLPTCSIRYIF